jgi:hypothetical protein
MAKELGLVNKRRSIATPAALHAQDFFLSQLLHQPTKAQSGKHKVNLYSPRMSNKRGQGNTLSQS